jgi:hypothetical protein
MSVLTTAPVDLPTVAAALGNGFSLNCSGNPGAAGAMLSANPANDAGITAALTAAYAQAAANATNTANAATINTNVKARQATIQAWIAANPTGAILTAAQTLVLAQMLNGLCNLLLAEFGSTSGT